MKNNLSTIEKMFDQIYISFKDLIFELFRKELIFKIKEANYNELNESDIPFDDEFDKTGDKYLNIGMIIFLTPYTRSETIWSNY